MLQDQIERKIKKYGEIFSFYDDQNKVIYLGTKGDDGIYCFEYNNRKKAIRISQKINFDIIIHNICVAPNKFLDSKKNEIIK